MGGVIIDEAIFIKEVIFMKKGDVIEADISSLTHDQREAIRKQLETCKEDHEETPNAAVEKFFEYYRNVQLKDVGIDDMRRIIPKFVWILDNHDHRSLKKLKGFWDTPPDWWDPKIPFLDPNNGRKSKNSKAKKPTKKDLLPILQYLILRYEAVCPSSLSSCQQVTDSPSSESCVDGDEDRSPELNKTLAEMARSVDKLPPSPGVEELRANLRKLCKVTNACGTTSSVTLQDISDDLQTDYKACSSIRCEHATPENNEVEIDVDDATTEACNIQPSQSLEDISVEGKFGVDDLDSAEEIFMSFLRQSYNSYVINDLPVLDADEVGCILEEEMDTGYPILSTDDLNENVD